MKTHRSRQVGGADLPVGPDARPRLPAEFTALEAAIDRELKRLPELSAPDALAKRILAAVGSRAAAPWYRRPWQFWPAGLRAASFAALLALFGGLCFGGWQLSRAGVFEPALHELAGAFAWLGTAWDVTRVLLESAWFVAEKLGPGFIAACVLVAVSSYLTCVALGTVFARYAFASRR